MFFLLDAFIEVLEVFALWLLKLQIWRDKLVAAQDLILSRIAANEFIRIEHKFYQSLRWRIPYRLKTDEDLQAEIRYYAVTAARLWNPLKSNGAKFTTFLWRHLGLWCRKFVQSSKRSHIDQRREIPTTDSDSEVQFSELSYAVVKVDINGHVTNLRTVKRQEAITAGSYSQRNSKPGWYSVSEDLTPETQDIVSKITADGEALDLIEAMSKRKHRPSHYFTAAMAIQESPERVRAAFAELRYLVEQS
jgi:hypothetical protein